MEPLTKDVPIEDTSLYNRDASSDPNSIEAVKAPFKNTVCRLRMRIIKTRTEREA